VDTTIDHWTEWTDDKIVEVLKNLLAEVKLKSIVEPNKALT
jgi:hypothetical protein